ncbi:MAG: septal ring lytic transglycosylase RlpA family protein [Desulfobulbus sp.]|nr:septal ring lytic transglycosylase RlpA family protein [Desulfobulbus sp.]
MTVRSVFRSTAHILTLCLFICLGFGCATKQAELKKSVPASGKKKSGIPATQRPYVINGITYYPIPSAAGYVERGIASWYGKPFHGRKTSNGETYNMYGDTAAHKTLPMDTMLLVKNLENGRSTTVRINDRGPFVQERIIDLSYSKAQELGVVGNGTARVEIIALGAQQAAELPMVASATGKPTEAGSRPKPKIKPPPIPDFDKGNFYVQVGAFVQVENARTLAKAFARRGRDVIIQQYPAAGMNLYRVMIFASTSLKQAKLYEQGLKNEGFRYALLLAR